MNFVHVVIFKTHNYNNYFFAFGRIIHTNTTIIGPNISATNFLKENKLENTNNLLSSRRYERKFCRKVIFNEIPSSIKKKGKGNEFFFVPDNFSFGYF